MTAPALSHIAYDDFVADVRAIAAQLTPGGWRPDFIVGVGRGGLAPAVYLSHATGIPLLSVDHSTQVPTFGDDLLARLAAKTAEGAKLLIVDDINDSGATLAYIRRSIATAGGIAANLRIAVMIDNVRSCERVDYRSRTIDRDENKAWFVFPWEAMAPDTASDVEADLAKHLVVQKSVS